jgi:hypothetical protein
MFTWFNTVAMVGSCQHSHEYSAAISCKTLANYVATIVISIVTVPRNHLLSVNIFSLSNDLTYHQI